MNDELTKENRSLETGIKAPDNVSEIMEEDAPLLSIDNLENKLYNILAHYCIERLPRQNLNDVIFCIRTDRIEIDMPGKPIKTLLTDLIIPEHIIKSYHITTILRHISERLSCLARFNGYYVDYYSQYIGIFRRKEE